MKKYNKNTIDTLSDVFAAWMGGYPDKDSEIKDFLQQSKLAELMSETDVEVLLYHNGFIAKENLSAVYSLIPVKLKTETKELALFPQMFNRMNLLTASRKNSRAINIDFAKSFQVQNLYYAPKYRFITENRNRLRALNQRVLHPETVRRQYLKRRQNLSDEQKAELREKARLKMQKYRAEHPEKVKEASARAWKKKDERQKTFARLASRKQNEKYRERHREEIRARRKEYRERLKNENPELLKEIDRSRNLAANRKKTCHEYFLRNKEAITQKAKENPKTKEYKQRYKAKKRFQTRTGVTVLSLLEAIIQNKQSR